MEIITTIVSIVIWSIFVWILFDLIRASLDNRRLKREMKEDLLLEQSKVWHWLDQDKFDKMISDKRIPLYQRFMLQKNIGEYGVSPDRFERFPDDIKALFHTEPSTSMEYKLSGVVYKSHAPEDDQE